MTRFGLSVIFGIFGMNAGRCADESMAVLLHMCSGFPTKWLEQMIVTSLYDYQGSLMLQWEGTIKGEHDWALGLLLLSSGCFNTSVWVFGKPQTLSAPWVGNISRMHSVVCFSKSMHPDLFGGLWVICDFIYLTAARQTTTSSPGTWYWVKHGSQPFGSELWGWD